MAKTIAQTQSVLAEAPIPVRKAIESARNYAVEVGFRPGAVEEVELTEDGKLWLITLGWPVPAPLKAEREYVYPKHHPLRSLEESRLPSPKTLYKLFQVDARSGQVRAMKIREP